MGATGSPDEVQTILTNASPRSDGSPDFDQRMGQAVSDLMMVQAVCNRASDVVKVTQPERVQKLALEDQAISVDLVEFLAKDYLSKAAAPTEPEIADQYAKNSAYEAENSPTGFGYKLPDRVKFQYIELPVAQLEKVATEGIDEKDIRLYWLQHQAKYMTAPSDLGPQPLNPTTLPTTRPFTAVRDQVYKDMKQEKMDDLTRSILGDINGTLTVDYVAFKKATASVGDAPTSIPADVETKAPQTALGVRYDTYDYLKKLALQIQNKL